MVDEKDIATKIMEGEIPPPNEMVSFIVRRAQELSAAGNQLMQIEQKLQERLTEVRKQIVETNGALLQYRKDLNLLGIKGKGEKAAWNTWCRKPFS